MKRGEYILVVGNILFVLIFILLIIQIVLALVVKEENTGDSVSVEGQGEISAATLGTATEGGYSYTSVSEGTPAQLTVSKDALLRRFENIPADTEIHTEYGDFTGAELSNAIFGNGGLYEAAITGIASGTVIYFLSSFDDQLFKFTAGDDETEVRVVQFQSNGETQERIYIQLADGDTIEQGTSTDSLPYEFIAGEDDATYIYSYTEDDEQQIATETGNFSSLLETITNIFGEEEVTTIIADSVFIRTELFPGNTYDVADYSVLNTGQETLIVCREDPLCDVNIDEKVFTIQGKVNVTSKGDLIYEGLDENNEVTLDFTENTFSFNNVLPEQNILALFYNGHVKLTETQGDIFFFPQETAHPNNFKTYISLFQDKTLSLEDNTLGYQNFAVFLPESSLYQSCLENEESCVLQEEPVQQAPEKEAAPSSYYIAAFLLLFVIAFFFFQKQKKKNRKGQLALFIALGLILVIIASLFFVFLQQDNTATEITKIESLEDARLAVESCITATIEKDLQAFGEHGGYIIETQYNLSQFNTTYELLSLEEMQENLQTGIERDLRDCTTVLEDTPYMFIPNGRIHVQAELGEKVKITGDSLGTIATEDEAQSTRMREIQQSYAINIPAIYSLTQELILSQEGVPVISSKTYGINIFVDKEYKEMLVEIQQNDPQFRFRVTKAV